jgi:hypothetical protein
LTRRALARAQRRGIASRRRRGLNSAVGQAHFGCQQLRRRSIDVRPHGRRRHQRTVARRRDTWVRAVMAVHRDTRASVRVASQKQQERRGKQAHQGTRKCRRHVSGWALTNCSNVRGSVPTIKRQLTPKLSYESFSVRLASRARDGRPAGRECAAYRLVATFDACRCRIRQPTLSRRKTTVRRARSAHSQ